MHQRLRQRFAAASKALRLAMAEKRVLQHELDELYGKRIKVTASISPTLAQFQASEGEAFVATAAAKMVD